MKTPRHILPVIVIAQFCCTSLWFAGNAVMADLVVAFSLPVSALGNLTRDRCRMASVNYIILDWNYIMD